LIDSAATAAQGAAFDADCARRSSMPFDAQTVGRVGGRESSLIVGGGRSRLLIQVMVARTWLGRALDALQLMRTTADRNANRHG